MIKLTEEEFEAELEEKTEDARIFSEAFELIDGRLKELERSSSSMLPLSSWAGATGVRDTLMVVTSMIVNMKDEFEMGRNQFIMNKVSGPSFLSVVEGGKDED